MTDTAIQQTTVLVVDDDRLLRRQLQWSLVGSHRVLEAETRLEAIELLRCERVDVVLCDLHLPPDTSGIGEGLAVVEAARDARPSIPVVVITGSENKQAALEAIRRGAYGFFEKPFDEDEVSHIIAQAARVRRLEAEVLRLRSELEMFRGFGRFVGTSAALEAVLKQARAVADTNATLLLTGENGTGKEVLARAIHEESARRDRPFVAVELRGAARTAHRVRTVRPREGRFHRRDADEEGSLRAGRRRHALPRRDRRTHARRAGETVARPAGA